MSTAAKFWWGIFLEFVHDLSILVYAYQLSLREDTILVGSAQYIPGVCNIGPAEIAVRKRVGWVGLALTALLWAFLAYGDVGKNWFVLLFFSSAISAVGFIQGRMRFCAAFGWRNVFNVGREVGKTDTVTQAEFRAQDRKKAWKIVAYSALVGISVTLVAYWLKGVVLKGVVP